MGQPVNLRFASAIQNICEINDSFASARLRVCYAGENRNGSFISKQSIEDAIPSMYNCPVVCNYDIESDTIGGHDVSFVETDSGDMRIINETSAVGVIPSGATTSFEMVTEDDGSSHEYFVTDALLWKRSPVYEKLVKDGIEAQSMEIDVNKGRSESGIFIIDEFSFTAFCLLGDGVEPCFESASLQMFECSDCKQQFALMMKELKESFQTVSASNGDDIDINREGGESLDENMKLNHGSETDNGHEEGVAAVSEETPGEPAQDVSEPIADAGDDTQFALSAEQFKTELCDALRKEMVSTDWGDYPRYSYCDYDGDAGEVFAFDSEDWNLYGFKYSMNGDNVVVDFGSKKRKKFSIVDFDEGDDETASFDTAFQLYSTIASDKSERKYSDRIAAAEAEVAKLNDEVASLRKYREEKMACERAAEESEIFENFQDLEGNTEFEALKSNCAELSIDALQEKCYAIRGRNVKLTFSTEKKRSTVRIPVEQHDQPKADEPYGGLFLEFPPAN